MKVAVLVTCFNRRDVSVRGLLSVANYLSAQQGVDFSIFVTDDGSSDGTGDALRAALPRAYITAGTGSLYWSGGMVAAYEQSREHSDSFDAYLLFNDDVQLIDEFQALCSFVVEGDWDVISGPVRNVEGEITYSGFRRGSRLRPFAFDQVVPCGQIVNVDTVNANVLFVKGPLFRALGGVDAVFAHGLGDLDLGLRAGALGARVQVWGEAVGLCEKGPGMDERIRRMTRSRRFRAVTGAPYGPGPSAAFAWRHGIKLLFPLYLAKLLLDRARLLIG